MSDRLASAADPTRSLDRFEVERLLDRVDFCEWNEGLNLDEAYAALVSYLEGVGANAATPACEGSGDDSLGLGMITVDASKIGALLAHIDGRRNWNQDAYDRLCAYLYDRINAANAPDQAGLKGSAA